MKTVTKYHASGLILVFAMLSQGCCIGASKTKPPVNPAATKMMEQQPLSGKVVESMDAGGYTYICLEKDGKKTWAAVPTTKVTVGEELELMPGAEMGPFTSKSLNRTFDQLIFSGGTLSKPSAPPAGMPPGHPAMPGAEEQMKTDTSEAKLAQPGKLLYSGKIVETMNSGGYTYILLEKDGVRSWAAIALTTVNVGDEIELLPGNEMGNFKSKSLNRTFDNIIFSQGIRK